MAAFRQTDVDRVIRGCEKAGLAVEAVEITVDGAIRVLTRRPAPGVAVNENHPVEDWTELAGKAEAPARA